MPEQGVQDLARRLREAIQFGKKAGELTPTKDAMVLWEKVYHRLATDDDPGPVGAVTARAEAQIIRLATHYALLDRSKQIDLPHLTAAVAFWQYCAKTAAYVFGGEAADNTEAEILSALVAAPASLSAINELFQGHTPARIYRQSLQRLETAGKIERYQGERINGGKAPIFYRLAENADLRKSTP
jgi:DNA replicative helicase MCM subunit Mcm2 (Cdc46/Mcm family)